MSKKQDEEVRDPDAYKVRLIIDRVAMAKGGISEDDRMTLFLSLIECHEGPCPMQLDEMLDNPRVRDFDVIHDVYGIANNYNPDTGKLENCFWPRLAQPLAAAE